MLSRSLVLSSFVAAAALVSQAEAFQLTFPGASGYWVANATNTAVWAANAGDPEYFSIELLNPNDKTLNGNYQVANAVVTSKGRADIPLTAIPPGTGYSLMFVNSSNYELNHPQLYYTSPVFEIKAPGSPLAAAPTGSALTPTVSSGPGASGSNAPGASASATSSAMTGAASAGSKKNGARALVSGFSSPLVVLGNLAVGLAIGLSTILVV